MKTLQKYKVVFLYNTIIAIDNPKSYIERQTGAITHTITDNHKSEGGLLNLKPKNVITVDDSIRILKNYLVQLKQYNTKNVHVSQFSRDIQRINNVLVKLYKLKEQCKSNLILYLNSYVKHLQNYLHNTYSLAFETDNSTRSYQTQNWPNLNVSSHLRSLIRGNESSQVIDLT